MLVKKNLKIEDQYRICKVTRIARDGDEAVHYRIQYLWYFLWSYPIWRTLRDKNAEDDEDMLLLFIIKEFDSLWLAEKRMDNLIKSDMKKIVETKIECHVK